MPVEMPVEMHMETPWQIHLQGGLFFSFFDLGPTAGPTLYLASRDFGIPDIFQVGFGLNSGLIFGNRGIDITHLSSALSRQPL